MTADQILDELEVWLREWERGLITACNGVNPFEGLQTAADYYLNRQVIGCLRHTQDKIKELREKDSAE